MDWKGRNKEEIPGSKRSMHSYNYTDLLQALKGELLSSAFSPSSTRDRLKGISDSLVLGGFLKNK